MGSPEEAARAWSRFLPNASLGFEPDILRCSMIHCARRSVLVIPSTALREGVQPLLKQCMPVGATAAFERETAAWHHDLWILSTPARDGMELWAWTQSGCPSYAGSGVRRRHECGKTNQREQRKSGGIHVIPQPCRCRSDATTNGNPTAPSGVLELVSFWHRQILGVAVLCLLRRIAAVRLRWV